MQVMLQRLSCILHCLTMCRGCRGVSVLPPPVPCLLDVSIGSHRQMTRRCTHTSAIVLQAHTTCHRHFVQRQPFSSQSSKQYSHRHAARLACRAPRPAVRCDARRYMATTCMDIRTMVDDVKQQVQKQRAAVVLGAVGLLASGLAFAGTVLSCSLSSNKGISLWSHPKKCWCVMQVQQVRRCSY